MSFIWRFQIRLRSIDVNLIIMLSFNGKCLIIRQPGNAPTLLSLLAEIKRYTMQGYSIVTVILLQGWHFR
jgi:hypothetical protein